MKVVLLLPIITREYFKTARKLENNFAREQKPSFEENTLL